MSRSIEDQMKITELESQVASARTVVSRSINILHQVRLALEEGDPDEALLIIVEATEGDGE